MTNYVETRISEINDPDFQSLIHELIHCVDWNTDVDQICEQPFSYLLMVIGREKKALTLQHLPVKGILNMRVEKLQFDSVLHHVCRELARLKGTPIESFDGKTVLTLIKRCHKIYCPKPPRRKTR